jgi:hypothetical protein
MSKLKIFLDTIEYIYYFSGIFVGIGVIFAFIQYKLIKKDTKIKYKREIISWTNELLRSFYKEILPKYEQLCKNLGQNKFFLPNNNYIIKPNNDELIKRCNNYINTLIDNIIINDMRELVINIQILAVGLTHGNADIEMANNVIGKKYIDIFETVLPYIMMDKNIELYNDSIDLFNKWNIEKKKYENKKQAETLKNVSLEVIVVNKNEI